jgi:hypothetical protein
LLFPSIFSTDCAYDSTTDGDFCYGCDDGTITIDYEYGFCAESSTTDDVTTCTFGTTWPTSYDSVDILNYAWYTDYSALTGTDDYYGSNTFYDNHEEYTICFDCDAYYEDADVSNCTTCYDDTNYTSTVALRTIWTHSYGCS